MVSLYWISVQNTRDCYYWTIPGSRSVNTRDHIGCPVKCGLKLLIPLRWRHNWCDSVSNHQPHDCLLNRLFRRRWKKTSNLRVTGLCEENSPVNSPHKWPVTRKMFPFDDVIMHYQTSAVEVWEKLCVSASIHTEAGVLTVITHAKLAHFHIDKMGVISQTTFPKAFLWMKNLYFDSILLKSVHWQKPVRHQAITWTSANTASWFIHAALRKMSKISIDMFIYTVKYVPILFRTLSLLLSNSMMRVGWIWT